ncbi:MAG: class I SAM-dependent methyltransferase [Sandaracinaceae bacterium]|nr:class I SAM-dependent methyltransferase [Sandaracinaceae bacterium]
MSGVASDGAGPRWWERFFDDAFAELWLSDDDAGERERRTDGLMRVLGLRAGSWLFDQCCGVGRVAVPLMERGVHVEGVDGVASYVARARARCESLPAGTLGHARFECGDALTYVPAARCDAAINWYTSFGYSDDDAANTAMLRCVREALRPGGLFALDYPDMERVRACFRPRSERTRDTPAAGASWPCARRTSTNSGGCWWIAGPSWPLAGRPAHARGRLGSTRATSCVCSCGASASRCCARWRPGTWATRRTLDAASCWPAGLCLGSRRRAPGPWGARLEPPMRHHAPCVTARRHPRGSVPRAAAHARQPAAGRPCSRRGGGRVRGQTRDRARAPWRARLLRGAHPGTPGARARPPSDRAHSLRAGRAGRDRARLRHRPRAPARGGPGCASRAHHAGRVRAPSRHVVREPARADQPVDPAAKRERAGWPAALPRRAAARAPQRLRGLRLRGLPGCRRLPERAGGNPRRLSACAHGAQCSGVRARHAVRRPPALQRCAAARAHPA